MKLEELKIQKTVEKTKSIGITTEGDDDHLRGSTVPKQ